MEATPTLVINYYCGFKQNVAQSAAHPEIGRTGATVDGQGKPGYPGGTQIPPTQVQVVRLCPEDTGCPQ